MGTDASFGALDWKGKGVHDDRPIHIKRGCGNCDASDGEEKVDKILDGGQNPLCSSFQISSSP
ncbi:hypothetical protein JHK85_023111 [Glycine max]|nr:hypothetical protein JHK85_023111 [Glycine max]